MGMMDLKVMSDADIERFHQKTLEVLENVGIKIAHDEALKKLAKAGAKVNETSQIAKLPAKMVQELLSQAPSLAVATGINDRQLSFGGSNRYYGSIVLDPFINDYNDGLRPPKLDDLRKHVIVSESLDRVSTSQRMQQPVTDVPEPDCYLKTMEVFLSNTSKHVVAMPTSVENCHEWLEVTSVIADAAGLGTDKTPLLTLAMAVTSPLQIHHINVEIMKMAIEKGYPIVPTICPMAGATSPYSVAGTALQGSVESLAAILLAQLYKPGHPVYYTFAPSVADMRSGHDLYYKAEKMTWKIMCCQMGKFYNLPISHETGGSLTHLPDIQNGAESFAYILASVCCGQHKFGGLGSLGNANAMSAEQMIMQAGLLDMAEYLAQGVDLSDYKFAMDSIASVGPGGSYLVDELTLDLLHSDEFFNSPYFDLSGGYIKGTPGMYEIAHQQVEDFVANYSPAVPDKVRTAIKNFFKDKYQDTKVADM
jgi:trimethylamine---corrinoid protein Co-methyltransferase